MTPGDRDPGDVDALRTDRYIDALLAAADARAAEPPVAADLDPAVRLATTRLARDLVRVHPSFRFEDRLAARLATAARAMRSGAAAGAGGTVVPMPLAPGGGRRSDPLLPGGVDDMELDDDLDLAARDPGLDPLDARHGVRPLLVGGALTSAALSIAGAAWVAWRRSRPAPASPMARAVRAARQARVVRSLS